MSEEFIRCIVIPHGARFSDLHLSHTDDGLDLDWSAVNRVCEASQIDAQIVRADPEKTTELLSVWYAQHIAAGGAPDPVMEHFELEARKVRSSPRPK